jgi:hypothetical protein
MEADGRQHEEPATVQTLKSAYQQADADTMLRVVLGAGELREAQ